MLYIKIPNRIVTDILICIRSSADVHSVNDIEAKISYIKLGSFSSLGVHRVCQRGTSGDKALWLANYTAFPSAY